MADGIAITAGSGTTVATDDLGATGHVQWMKLRDGTDGGTETIPGTAARGLSVDPRLKVVRLAVTPTISTTPAYTAKDAVGGLMTFSNAARLSGAPITIQSVEVVDKSQQMKELDLVLFRATITAPTDNAIFAPSDAELLDCIGVINIGPVDYRDFSTNSVAARTGLAFECLPSGTDLFGVLVARGTPTYVSTSDLVVALTIVQD